MNAVSPSIGPEQTNNPFQYFWDLGWTRVIPLLPVGATPDHGWAAKRGDSIAYGKMPAIKQGDGTWLPFSGWGTRDTEESDLHRWNDWGANVGFRLPADWLVFDIDIMDGRWADVSERIITEHLGVSPCRVGQAPKRMLFYRLSEPTKGGWVYGETDNGTERIEIFTNGRNTVLAGTHPKTNAPFQWPRPPVHADHLPRVTPEQLEATWQALVDALPEGSRTAASNAADRELINQHALKGDLETVRKAVQAMPNNRDIYPERDAYIKVGAAIKAALPDDEHEAFELWCEWAAKDNGGTPELWEKDWRGLGDTFSVGAQWLYEEAERVSRGQFQTAEAYFEPVQPSTDPFDIQMEHERQEHQPDDTFEILTLDQIVKRPPPTFMIDRHIPETSVGFLYADPGVGKSFLAMDIGLHVAHGMQDWHGEAMHLPDNAATIYIAAEGSFDLRNRILAWHKARGVEQMTDRFLVIEQTVRFTKADDIEKLKRTIRATGVKPAFVVVDTVSRALPGVVENAQEDMTVFVEACAVVQREFKCSVLGLHHTNKSGGMRGSTVLGGAGDYIIKMERKKGKPTATVTMEKQKAAEDGWSYEMTLDSVDLGDGETSLVVNRVPTAGALASGGGDDGKSLERRILEAIQKAWDDGEPMSIAKNAKKERRAVLRLSSENKETGGLGVRADVVSDVLSRMMLKGWIVETVVSGHSRVKGLQVGGGALEALAAYEVGQHFSPIADEDVPSEPDTTSVNEVNEDAFG